MSALKELIRLLVLQRVLIVLLENMVLQLVHLLKMNVYWHIMVFMQMETIHIHVQKVLIKMMKVE